MALRPVAGWNWGLIDGAVFVAEFWTAFGTELCFGVLGTFGAFEPGRPYDAGGGEVLVAFLGHGRFSFGACGYAL